MSQSLDEKRKSLSNAKAEVLEARVIANYGDPGLDEDYHFDVMSRYVIVMLESCYRVPSLDKWHEVFAVVARPQHLWVSAEEGKASSPSSQRRADRVGNMSVGVAGSFSVNGISRMNYPYQMGELIKIKKLPVALTAENSTLFTSAFSDVPDSYNSWHTQGSTLAYFAGDSFKISSLRFKTIYQSNAALLQQYAMVLYKYQYEAFMLSLIAGSSTTLNEYITSIFANTLPSSDPVFMGHGGYAFKSSNYLECLAVEYEDINIGNKQRVTTSECLPLIVATPNSFPTPKVRAVGNIAYNPTYATIVKS